MHLVTTKYKSFSSPSSRPFAHAFYRLFHSHFVFIDFINPESVQIKQRRFLQHCFYCADLRIFMLNALYRIFCWCWNILCVVTASFYRNSFALLFFHRKSTGFWMQFLCLACLFRHRDMRYHHQYICIVHHVERVFAQK